MYSLLDNDLYKFTMMQAVLHQFPNTDVEYKFVCRTPNVDLTVFIDSLENKLWQMCKSQLTFEELQYLRSIRFLKPDFVNFLEHFKLKPDLVKFDKEDGQLTVRIKGDWVSTILFEVPLLAMISETYMESQMPDGSMQKQRWHNLKDKVEWYKDSKCDFKFIDFGTRRRASRISQDFVVANLKRQLPDSFIGTSNVMLAMKYNLKPIGTMAHEWIQAGQGMEDTRLSKSQSFMLQKWADTYRGDLGLALTDTISMDAFLKDFDAYFSKLYDGCRHDSGDPIEWGEKLIKHYTDFGINPMWKTAVFSDGLNFQECHRIEQHFKGRIKTLYGIGTNLSNDCGVKPLSIVIKLINVNGHPVAKLSDEPSKTICEDQEFLSYLKKVFNYGR